MKTTLYVYITIQHQSLLVARVRIHCQTRESAFVMAIAYVRINVVRMRAFTHIRVLQRAEIQLSMHVLQCFIRHMHHVGMQFVTHPAKRPAITVQQLSTIRCKRLVWQTLGHDVTYILCARYMQQTYATIGLS